MMSIEAIASAIRLSRKECRETSFCRDCPYKHYADCSAYKAAEYVKNVIERMQENEKS